MQKDCIVVSQGVSVYQLLSSENESLLLRWDSFFVLDLSFDVLDGVCWLRVQGDSSAAIFIFQKSDIAQTNQR